MSLTKKKWFTYLALSLLALGLWLRLGYREFSFVDLSISKLKALKTAQEYLSAQGVDVKEYKHVLVLATDDAADRYLQKTLGFQEELAFLKKYNFSLFHWVIRFFKEGQKEEYRVTIDSSRGNVVSSSHTIEDTARREDTPLETAHEQAVKFLSQTFSINFDDYTAKEKVTKKYDNRTDYSFSWQKNDVSIPWSQEKNAGTAKLLVRARVSGQDILYFDAATLEIPDDFNRSIEKSKQSGRILTGLFLVFYYVLIMVSTYLVVIKRYHLIMQLSKKFYVGLALGLFTLILLFYINNIPDILFDYPTTSTLRVYFGELSLGLIVSSAFFALAIILPGLAGESLAQESKPKNLGFAPYIQSTFFSRNVSGLIMLGYLVAVMMLGLQSLLFYLGRAYGDVWTERLQIAQASSSFWPFLTALVISFRAGISEEIFFRLFGVHWAEKIFKNTILACLVTSVIWGFGHTHYPIFPVWFRGLEVSFLGFLLCFFYLRHGIIPVVVGHFLFDAFWGSAGFLLGKAQTIDFIMCLLVILLPMLFAIVAFIINKPELQKKTEIIFKKYQLFNLNILTSFLSNPKNIIGKTKKDLREELINHGWDSVVIDEALRRIDKNEIAN
jgi:membrane protease YdiL (CAAX protease family)